MIVKWLLSYIQFIEWFFTCFDLYVFYFHFVNCRGYVIDCFTKSEFFVWLWNNYHFISSLLFIFSLLRSVWFFVSFELFRLINYLAVKQEVITLYDFEIMITLYPVNWLIEFMLRFLSCSLIFVLLKSVCYRLYDDKWLYLMILKSW